VSFGAVLLRLVLHRLLRFRTLNTGEVLVLGLFEGAVLYHALIENPSVGAGCFLGFGCRLLLEHLKAPDPTNFACSLLGVALGVLMSNVISQLWEEAAVLFEPEWVEKETVVIRRRRPSHRRRRSTRTHIAGAPDPDPPSIQLSRRTDYNVLESPVMSQWEGLQQPLKRHMGLENEVTELRRRASAAAGQTRKLQEERKWAWDQSNPARAFQLGWDIKRFQELSEKLNREAAEKVAIARSHSLLAKGGDVELSGLSSTDAIDLTDRRLRSAKVAGDSHLRISLLGNTISVSHHDSRGRTNQVRTLLETHLRRLHHSVIQDPSNRDYLIVSVDSDVASSNGAPASDDWSRALD